MGIDKHQGKCCKRCKKGTDSEGDQNGRLIIKRKSRSYIFKIGILALIGREKEVGETLLRKTMDPLWRDKGVNMEKLLTKKDPKTIPSQTTGT